jgi:hypothetical protein
MKLLTQPEGTQIDLAPEEILLFGNSLGEVLFGFAVKNFDVVMDATEPEVAGLFERVRSLGTDRNACIPITSRELHIFKNALQETLRELGAEEFSIRTGLDFKFGETRLRELEATMVEWTF